MDIDLASEEKAIDHAFGKMLEEHLYWVRMHARWKLENNRPALQNAFFGQIPFPANKIIARMARRNMLQQLYQQGTGRHSEAEIVAIGDRALQALADFLGNKRFFLGSKPTSLDATAYGMRVQFIRVPQFAAPIIDRAKAYPNLVDYTERFHHLYFNALAPAEDG